MPTRKYLYVFISLFFLLSLSNAHAAINYTSSYLLADSFAYNQTYNSTNFGTTNYMWQTAYATSKMYIGYPFFLWNSSMIPPSVTINSAYLYIYLQSAPPPNNPEIIDVYNTTLAWNETNITFVNMPANHTLISSESIKSFINGCGVGVNCWGYRKINVTDALIHAYNSGQYMSIELRFHNETSDSNKGGWTWTSKEGGNKPKLEIDYSVSDCIVSCGDCGCKAGTTECYVPPIVGSYCANEDGLPNSVKTLPYSNCTNTTYFACPSGTLCTQVTPIFNFSNVTASGNIFENPAWVPANQAQYCNGCWFINAPLPCQGNPLSVCWTPIASNCFDSLIPLKFRLACDCQAASCSANIYNTSTTTFNHTIIQWSAGCWDTSRQQYFIIINETGENTTLDEMVKEACSDCNLSSATPSNICTKLNTSTTCYNAKCNPIQCTIGAGQVCESNYGGQAALAIGSMVGVTDCGLSEALISIITAMSIGFVLLFYTKNGEHGGQSFIFGTLIVLVMFSLISWFPSWLMVILIVISGYLVAKSLGIGGGG
jgi:hypothetical protein